MFLLDTNVISAFRRLDRMEPNVKRWAAGADEFDLFLSAVTLFELERGAGLMSRRDPAQGAILRNWIDREVVPAFSPRFLSVDAAVARCAAALHVPDPRPERDAFIAATALVHGMTVVTRNVRDFEGLGVPLLNPWETP
ncbi:twitching motility protein PilT [Aureimonas endophytica]|uniref:Ribonuclease VapC n=1 Tax=Aureimonas endophytica TaxID=2027858 RepID=A0A916ZPV9_9HYPH|nr:type II toxin-antitoxin system VapC family toxin [Aureimonas endophytica]GGE08142.1 twitching motility protein PilT [Aureimonas endophytica]